MDEDYLIAATRYLALNPVTARLAKAAADWPHASVRAHLSGRDDGLVTVAPLLERVTNFADLLSSDGGDRSAAFEAPVANGRPLGGEAFLADVETKLGRSVKPGKRGPKPRSEL
jgi:putative transposase